MLLFAPRQPLRFSIVRVYSLGCQKLSASAETNAMRELGVLRHTQTPLPLWGGNVMFT